MKEDEIREIYRWAGCREAMTPVREYAGPCDPKTEQEDIERAARWVRPQSERTDR